MTTGWGNAPFAGSSWATNNDAGIALHALMRSGYGAIAYSPSTRRYGTSFGWDHQADAERVALQQCAAFDARVLVWGRNTMLSLALADDGSWGCGWDQRPRHARKRALKACQGPNPRIAAVFNSRTGR